jgi:hypothetical protein
MTTQTVRVVLDLRYSRLTDDHVFVAYPIIVDKIAEDPTKKYTVNLYFNQMTSKTNVVMEKLLLENESVEYVCIVECPSSSAGSGSYFDNLPDRLLKKIIWISNASIHEGAWQDLITNDKKQKLVVDCHKAFYKLFGSSLTQLGAHKRKSYTVYDLRDDVQNAPAYTYYYCSKCYYADVTKTAVNKHIAMEHQLTQGIPAKSIPISADTNLVSRTRTLFAIIDKKILPISKGLGGGARRTAKQISAEIYVELQKK